MIELRWLSFKSTKTLQYRIYTAPPTLIGPRYSGYGWSEWKEVPVVNASDIAVAGADKIA